MTGNCNLFPVNPSSLSKTTQHEVDEVKLKLLESQIKAVSRRTEDDVHYSDGRGTNPIRSQFEETSLWLSPSQRHDGIEARAMNSETVLVFLSAIIVATKVNSSNMFVCPLCYEEYAASSSKPFKHCVRSSPAQQRKPMQCIRTVSAPHPRNGASRYNAFGQCPPPLHAAMPAATIRALCWPPQITSIYELSNKLEHTGAKGALQSASTACAMDSRVAFVA